jgi:hypothetical protein
MFRDFTVSRVCCAGPFWLNSDSTLLQFHLVGEPSGDSVSHFVCSYLTVRIVYHSRLNSAMVLCLPVMSFGLDVGMSGMEGRDTQLRDVLCSVTAVFLISAFLRKPPLEPGPN